MVVWDGKAIVGSHPGLISATDGTEGVAFTTKNGAFVFESTPVKAANSAME